MNQIKQSHDMEDADVAELVLKEAKGLGASDAEVSLVRARGLSVRVRNREVESIQHQNDNALSISLYMGKHKGAASSSDLRPESIRRIVAAARDIARHSSEDECVGLADCSGTARALPELDLCHAWELSPPDAAALAAETESAALDQEPRISGSEGSSVDSCHERVAYANTAGDFHRWETTTHSLGCEVIAKDGGGMQCGGWYDVSRRHAALESAEEIGGRAARRAARKLSPRAHGSDSDAMVMFEAPVAKALVSSLVRALQGVNLYRKSSFLLDALGSRIFPEWVNIAERPHLPGGIASAPIDDDGVPTKDKEVIAEGIVGSYFLGSYDARRLGMKTTANAGGVHNLVVRPGNRDFFELLGDMGDGLLITELMGTGANLVTGDYSQGASGFVVENGKVSYPVENISVAGNLRQIFSRLVAVGNDVDERSYIHCGSMLFEGITVAGNSQD